MKETNSPPPPLPPPLQALCKPSSAKRSKPSGSSLFAKRDLVNMERNRREKMAEFYTVLQSMVPNLFPKATRTRIIDDTIAYIKGLEDMAIALETAKAAREAPELLVPPPTETGPSVEVTVSGDALLFSVHKTFRPGIVTQVLQVFEKHRAEVMVATVTDHDGDRRRTMSVTAIVPDDGAVERIKGDLTII